MATLEYEVTFVFGNINVVALSFVDEGDFVDDETLSEVVIRRAVNAVEEELGDVAGDYEEVSIKHTGTIGG